MSISVGCIWILCLSLLQAATGQTGQSSKHRPATCFFWDPFYFTRRVPANDHLPAKKVRLYQPTCYLLLLVKSNLFGSLKYFSCRILPTFSLHPTFVCFFVFIIVQNNRAHVEAWFLDLKTPIGAKEVLEMEANGSQEAAVGRLVFIFLKPWGASWSYELSFPSRWECCIHILIVMTCYFTNLPFFLKFIVPVRLDPRMCHSHNMGSSWC